jgi:hypothetical protein
MGEDIRPFNQSRLKLECKLLTPSAALSNRGALQHSTGVYSSLPERPAVGYELSFTPCNQVKLSMSRSGARANGIENT